jgi:hypothetical protein
MRKMAAIAGVPLRGRLVVSAVAAMALGWGGACSGLTTSNSETTTAPPTPIPETMAGTWTLEGAKNCELTLSPGNYRFHCAGSTPSRSATGAVRVDGDHVFFSKGNGCTARAPRDVGEYRWSVVDTKLSFVAIGSDPCGRKSVLAGRTYTRMP